MSYQWDLLLLEAGFLAIFLTAGSRIVVWLYRWLIFRYLFLSGVVKLLSGHLTWQHLTALDYHFWTQPLPLPLLGMRPSCRIGSSPRRRPPLSSSSSSSPSSFSCPAVRARVAAWCVLLFQLAILLTGNYGFFNLLTMALCVFLFDDAAMRHLLPRVLHTGWQPRPSTRDAPLPLSPPRWRSSSYLSASTTSGRPSPEPACLLREASRSGFHRCWSSILMDRSPP